MNFFDKIENKEKRNYVFIDYARVFACFIVIFNHLMINITKDFSYTGNVFSNIIQFNCFVNYVFFIALGYTFMKSKIELNIKMSLFLVLKNYISLMIFSIPFCFIEILWNNKLVYNSNMIIQTINNALLGRTWDHLWFMYVLLIIYLLLPFLSKIYKSEDNKLLPIWTFIFFIMILLNVRINITSPIYMFNWIPLSNVIFTVSLGAFLQRYNLFDRINKWIVLLIILIMIFIGFKFSIVYKYINYNFCQLMFACFVFLAFEKFVSVKNKYISYISNYAFLVYIIHVFFLHILTKVIKYNPYLQFGFMGIIIGTLVIYMISIFFAYIIKHIPYIKNFY